MTVGMPRGGISLKISCGYHVQICPIIYYHHLPLPCDNQHVCKPGPSGMELRFYLSSSAHISRVITRLILSGRQCSDQFDTSENNLWSNELECLRSEVSEQEK